VRHGINEIVTTTEMIATGYSDAGCSKCSTMFGGDSDRNEHGTSRPSYSNVQGNSVAGKMKNG
jgi:hypothetical protein